MSRVEEIFGKYHQRLSDTNTANLIGTVSRATSMLIESLGPEVHVGELCRLTTQSEEKPGQITRIFFFPSFGNDSNVLSVYGLSQSCGPNLD